LKLAEKIKKLRKIHNLTQKKLAEKIGLERKQICLYETGESKPSVDALKKLAIVFGVTTDFLLNDLKDENLDYFGFTDKELFIYFKVIDKMDSNLRNAFKIVMKRFIMADSLITKTKI
jgi:transcriptional regulator with XRE-family HTH domain